MARLRYQSIEKAAKSAAFAKGQPAIKELLMAHGFASRLGLTLDGDLNDSPDILTTSLVKCCLKVNGSYKYKAPDIAAIPEASYCLSNRFVREIESYPSLQWVIILGEPGWEAVNSIRVGHVTVRQHLESRGVRLLNFPHFAQNFQQRAIFRLVPGTEEEYFNRNPSHRAYAPKALFMRDAVLNAIANGLERREAVASISKAGQ